MLKVTLESIALSPGNILLVKIRGIERAEQVTNVSVNLLRIDKDYSEWVFGWGAKPSVEDEALTTSTPHTSDLEPGIHELASIKVSYEQAIPDAEATFIHGRDFERVFLDVVPTGSKGRTEETLKSEVMHIEQAREVRCRASKG